MLQAPSSVAATSRFSPIAAIAKQLRRLCAWWRGNRGVPLSPAAAAPGPASPQRGEQKEAGPQGRTQISPASRPSPAPGAGVRPRRGSGPGEPGALPAITHAGLAHVWFEYIHPFADGKGRIGRAIAELARALATSTPRFTGISAVLHRQRSSYYEQLRRHSVRLDINAWLQWFAQQGLQAQAEADEQLVCLLIDKAALVARLAGQLNFRQEKALLRLLRERPIGFAGGLSAGNYARITGPPPAMVTRDLEDLVNKEALRRTGERKGARYWLVVVGE